MTAYFVLNLSSLRITAPVQVLEPGAGQGHNQGPMLYQNAVGGLGGSGRAPTHLASRGQTWSNPSRELKRRVVPRSALKVSPRILVVAAPSKS